MFTDEQIKLLSRKLDPSIVHQRAGGGGKQLSYIEGWKAIDIANGIFGFGRWDRELLRLEEVGAGSKTQKGLHIVAYIATVRIAVHQDGHRSVYRDGTGWGQSFGRNLAEAHENAVKEAETDAMKRALMTFGNQFGLALYDKEQANVGVDDDEDVAAAPAGETPYQRILRQVPTVYSIDDLNALWAGLKPERSTLDKDQLKHVTSVFAARKKEVATKDAGDDGMGQE